MACTANLYRIVTIKHGSTDVVTECTGGSITEEVTFRENRPGTRKSPCIAIDSYGMRCDAEGSGFTTPIVRGTKAALTYTLENFANATTSTVVASNVRAGAARFDFNASPAFKQGQEFVYDAADSESLAPIAVSL